ncbi:hypothetical protein BaRGS_00029724 [Batillaria attramentaria]|uniref:Uncharacterized protein n=1 Tax=Batillaria attramentaria TaxID=370345 RepID=A0ABD0JWG2_9CAEN
MSSFRRFTIGLCLVMISMVGIVETGNRQSVPPPESLGPNDVMPIFEMLREGGDRTLAEANEEKKRKHEERKRANPKLKSEFYPYRQYIVAIVVSRKEIEDVRKTSKEGRDSFYELLQKEGRHVFQINERSKEKPPCAEEPCGKRPNYPWHGEVIAIHKQRFDKAIKQFLDKQKGKHPILLLYSHYIPCAKLPSTFGYSCSEELATFKKKNRNLKMFVAFSRYFFKLMAELHTTS